MNKHDNPQAFPRQGGTWGDGARGMSLRDYFAGQALAGLLTSGANHYEWQQTAKIAFSQADAMLAERERQQ